jgi:Zn finger protein HypA/HybF involved in hydrogenase expression
MNDIDSIVEWDRDTDPRNPANAVSLDIVACWCRTCTKPQDVDSEVAFCEDCGDFVIYQENDGTLYTYDRQAGKYEIFE